jgi:hypothetical protein
MPLDAFNTWADKARAAPIEREIERRGIHLRGGVDRCGPCPKCGGDDRFSINTAKGVWNCRGCDKGGDVIEFVQHVDGVDFVHACQTLTGEPQPNGKRYYPRLKHVVATYEYRDENGAIAYVIDRVEFQAGNGVFVLKDGKRKKEFRQRRPDPDHPGEWLYNVDGVTKVPYRPPELIEAVASQQLIFIVEGEGKVDALCEIGIVATCNPGGAGKWQPEMSERLRGADVILLPDNDEPGWKHVREVGAALAGITNRTRILLLPDLSTKGDIRDWLAAGGTREQLDALVEAAPDWQPPQEASADTGKAKATANEQALIDELARLDAVEYDRRRDEAADQMRVRRGTLDGEVERRRREQAEEAGPPPLFGHWMVEPWPEVVHAGELLLAIVGRIKRHVVLTDEQAVAVALWVLFAWVHDTAAVHSPILLATSAEANSGKTTLINVVRFLVPRSLVCAGISEAALFRVVEKYEPTIIVDEADVLLLENEPLRAVINGGWTRGFSVVRCVGDDNTPHAFPTFCPKALGMKGKRLPDTTLSRAIVIEMQRKKAGDQAVHFRSIDDAGLAELRRRALRWSMDNGEKLDGGEPDMPPGFDYRLGDNWRRQLAIADAAGDEWPDKARKAAVRLSEVADAASIGVQLLAVIKVAFDGADGVNPLDRISSAELAETVGADASSPFSEWKGGKPITQAQLARVLKPFGIAPEATRLLGGGRLRGYQRVQFEDAWERYLPAELTGSKCDTVTNPVDKGEVDDF